MYDRIRIAALPVGAMLSGVLLLIGAGVSSAAPSQLPLAQAAPPDFPTFGTVMADDAHRMAILWFAGEAGNWDLAKYQIGGMHDIEAIGAVAEPTRAAALKSFESSFLDPVEAAVDANDKAQFESTYKAAVQGCNACHGATADTDFPKGHGFIKVKVPTDTPDSIWSYAP